jgi:hypothetical protein
MPLTRKRKPSPKQVEANHHDAQESSGRALPGASSGFALMRSCTPCAPTLFREPMAKNVAAGLALPASGRAIGAVSGKPKSYIAPTAVAGASTTTARALLSGFV